MGSGLDEQLELLLGLGERLNAKRTELAEALLKVRTKGGRLRSLRANRVQREFERRAGQRNIVLKARQLGLTTWIAGRFFLETITRPGTVTVQVAHDQRSGEEIFKIVHRFLENLPEEMRKGALRTSKSNVREIVFPEIDSTYRVETAADPNAGRGLTIRNLHCSEVALWPGDVAGTLAALRAAVPADGMVVLESTPKGAAGPFYEEWQRAEEAGVVRHFFPWWWEESYRAPWGGGELRAEEAALVQREGLSLEQLAFRRQLQANFRGLMRQEFAEDAETCFLVSGECFFDVELVQERLRDVVESRTEESRAADGADGRGWVQETEVLRRERAKGRALAQDDNVGNQGTRLLRFYPAVRGREYVVAVDPAGGGVDGDYACVQVLDRETGLQCAELRAHLSPRETAHKAAALAHEYGEAVLVVERNNHGHEVLAYLHHEIAYPMLYEERGQLGWLTGVANRGPMLAGMEAWFAMYPERVSSVRLLEEMKTFLRKADGRAAAANGAHDDAVMAFAIGLAARVNRG
jgi:Terminase RNaseH-like domain